MTAILNQHENYLQADQAYGFPLLIKNLLSRAKVVSGNKKIPSAGAADCQWQRAGPARRAGFHRFIHQSSAVRICASPKSGQAS